MRRRALVGPRRYFVALVSEIQDTNLESRDGTERMERVSVDRPLRQFCRLRPGTPWYALARPWRVERRTESDLHKMINRRVIQMPWCLPPSATVRGQVQA